MRAARPSRRCPLVTRPACAASRPPELRRPLGIAIVGGLIFSQMMTLYTTPVVYLYMDRFRIWLDRKRKRSFSTDTTAQDVQT